jgi:hypothetical protein
MPQGALLEAFIDPPVVCFTKGDLACATHVALMAMAAAPVLEYARGLASGAWWGHALFCYDAHFSSIPVEQSLKQALRAHILGA